MTMNTATLRITLVAATRMAHPLPSDSLPWNSWVTDAATDAEALAEFAGRNCYQSWRNPSKRTNREYLGNILAQEHFSVLEHAGFTVALTGVSRSLTHELVRHRHLSFSQLSQRYFDEKNAAMVIPPLFRGDPRAEAILARVQETCLEAYRELLAIAEERVGDDQDPTGRRKRAREAARAVLPNMTETAIVVSGNHRSWREFFEKRGNRHADAEIRELAVRLFREIAQPLAPAVYQDFTVRAVRLPSGQEITELYRMKRGPSATAGERKSSASPEEEGGVPT